MNSWLIIAFLLWAILGFVVYAKISIELASSLRDKENRTGSLVKYIVFSLLCGPISFIFLSVILFTEIISPKIVNWIKN